MGWAWWRGWAGESSRCEDPAPTVGRLRGYHCDPNVAIAASMRIPYHAWRITVFITDAALLGRALAPLGTAPTENIMSNPVMVRHVMPF